MNYIIFDLEMNQTNIKKEDLKMTNEIIQIGAIKLNEYLEVINRFNAHIKPQINKFIPSFILNLTGLNYNKLIKSDPFPIVMDKFKNWINNEDIVFCTWGKDDIIELRKNCLYYDIDDSWINEYIDIQRYVVEIMKYNQIKSLSKVIKELGLPATLRFHRASNDASYVVDIMNYLFKPAYLKNNIVNVNSIPSINPTKKLIFRCKECGRFIKVSNAKTIKRNYLRIRGYCSNCNKKTDKIINLNTTKINLEQLKTTK